MSNTEWKLAFSDGNKIRLVSIGASNMSRFQVELENAKKRFNLVVGAAVSVRAIAVRAFTLTHAVHLLNFGFADNEDGIIVHNITSFIVHNITSFGFSNRFVSFAKP